MKKKFLLNKKKLFILAHWCCGRPIVKVLGSETVMSQVLFELLGMKDNFVWTTKYSSPHLIG